MRVLLIKTSSMGDVLHTLPALSDAQHAYPNIQFDWVVEESFAEIPTWHQAVHEVIPVSLRHWRKNIFHSATRSDWQSFRKQLKSRSYDYIIDAQGLIKSAFIGYFAQGKRVGLDWRSARESLASIAYQHKCRVNFQQGAIDRMRQLMSQALHYPLPHSLPDFGVDRAQFSNNKSDTQPYLVFLHATSWDNKQWPESYWVKLAEIAAANQYEIKISGGSEAELTRAARMSQRVAAMTLLPRQTITQMAHLLANSQGAIAVDTGFAHLAGALGVPTLALFGPTNAKFTGIVGNHAQNLQTEFHCSPCMRRKCRYQAEAIMPPCFQTLPPEMVWQHFGRLLK